VKIVQIEYLYDFAEFLCEVLGQFKYLPQRPGAAGQKKEGFRPLNKTKI
jgi:hypothetical protein